MVKALPMEKYYLCFEGDRREWCQTFNLKFTTKHKGSAEVWVSADHENRWMEEICLSKEHQNGLETTPGSTQPSTADGG